MRIGLIFAAALTVAIGVAPAEAAGCSVAMAKGWVPAKGQVYGTEAYSNGSSCGAAVVTIVVRARNGQVVWTEAMAAAHLMTFGGAKTPNRMKAALADWLAQQHPFKSSGDLPEWKKGAEAPAQLGEFPFYPEVDQETYARVRSEKQPLFCYVQGMESMACVAITKDGSAAKIGVQTFPG